MGRSNAKSVAFLLIPPWCCLCPANHGLSQAAPSPKFKYLLTYAPVASLLVVRCRKLGKSGDWEVFPCSITSPNESLGTPDHGVG